MRKNIKVLHGLTLSFFLLFFIGCGEINKIETPDTKKPSVIEQFPLNGATGVPLNTSISASFSENVYVDNFSVSGISGTVSGDGTKTISFTPSRDLDYATQYTVTINLRDAAGNTEKIAWSFTTALPAFTVHTTPDWTNNVGQYNSIAISPADGNKYITYTDSTSNTLKIISTSDGTLWFPPAVIGASVLGHSAMAIDSAGNIHVVYLQEGSPNKVIYTSSGAGWLAPAVLADTTVTDIYPAIAIDSNNNVHISCASDTGLSYITDITGAWQTLAVDSGNIGEYPGFYTSIKVDGSIVHISYYDPVNENLKYARSGNIAPQTEPGCNPGWNCYTLDSTGNVGMHSSLALYSGKVYITYYDSTNRRIKLITDESGDFISSVAFSNLSGETACPLFIEPDGRMHMSYISGQALYYASSRWGWAAYNVDSLIGNGVYTSIAVDSSGKAYISYYDATDQDLKYAHQTS